MKAILSGALTLGALAVAAGLAISRAGADVPTWSLVLPIGFALGLTVAYGARARRWLREVDELEWQTALNGYSSALLHGVLDTG